MGVGGCIVAAGISWASSEYGLASDPHNLLDGQVVTSNGRVLWASEDPDLLWALRGGGSSFGGRSTILNSLGSRASNEYLAVVVAVKLRVYKYTKSIYTGNILYPNESLHEVAKAISDFTRRTQDPKMAMHLYCLDTAHAALTGQSPAPGIMVVIYDANGEVHGRSEQGFGWALRIKGAVDNTRAMSRTEANQQQGERPLFSEPRLLVLGKGRTKALKRQPSRSIWHDKQLDVRCHDPRPGRRLDLPHVEMVQQVVGERPEAERWLVCAS